MLKIIYRVYPNVSASCGLSVSKEEIIANSLRSLKESLGDMSYEMFVILDSCPKSYKTLISSSMNNGNIKFYLYDGLGNFKSFEKCLDLALQQNAGDIIFFLEDDYVFSKSYPIKELMLDVKSGAFYTPYVNPEVFNSYLMPAKIGDYTSIASTTMTFIATQDMVLEYFSVFKLFVSGQKDTLMWWLITKPKGLFSIFLIRLISSYIKRIMFKKSSLTSRPGLRVAKDILSLSYITKYIRIKKSRLYCPINSSASHLAYNFIADDLIKDLADLGWIKDDYANIYNKHGRS